MKDESKNKTQNSKKKKTLAIVVFFAALTLALLALACFLIDAYVKKEKTSGSETDVDTEPAFIERTTFYPADFDEDITLDERYMSLERRIEYEEDGVTQYIDPENPELCGERAGFFDAYIKTLISGDWEKYPSYFASSYSENDADERCDEAAYEKRRFTAQKIFSVQISRLDKSETDEDGKTYIREVFRVKYKIFENNGTFRKDISDDEMTVPLIFETVSCDGVTKIFKVYRYYVA